LTFVLKVCATPVRIYKELDRVGKLISDIVLSLLSWMVVEDRV